VHKPKTRVASSSWPYNMQETARDAHHSCKSYYTLEWEAKVLPQRTTELSTQLGYQTVTHQGGHRRGSHEKGGESMGKSTTAQQLKEPPKLTRKRGAAFARCMPKKQVLRAALMWRCPLTERGHACMGWDFGDWGC
jgi:hypothetical protein